MENKYFDSLNGLRHYFICTKGDFALNSLEKLHYDEFMYRLLRNCGYKRIIFYDYTANYYYAYAFDSFSYYSFYYPLLFREIVKDANNEEQLKEFETALNQKLNTGRDKAVAAFGTQNTQAAQENKVSLDDFGKIFDKRSKFDFNNLNKLSEDLRNYAYNALISGNNCKTAVVFSLHLLHGGETNFTIKDQINNSIVPVFTDLANNCTTTGNIIVFAANNRSELARYFTEYPSLFGINTFSNDNTDQAGSIAKSIIKLEENLSCLEADEFPVDEIYNLLLRHKYLGDSSDGISKISASKLYSLAKCLSDNYKYDSKDSKFETIDRRKNPDKGVVNLIEELFDKKKVVDELVEVSERLDDSEYRENSDILPTDISRAGVNYQIVEPCNFEAAMKKLNRMIGLDSVKKEVSDIAAVFQAKKIIGDISEESEGPGNYAFIGNPGTGKTVVAKLMGQVFNALGVLKTDNVVYAKAADLVAGFVGQTSIKTRKVCNSALDGVLVVDEAHQLVNQDSKGEIFSDDFQKQAYNEIMTFMENHRDRICVIFTGYKKEMARFIAADPGMEGRNLRQIEFPDYNADELNQILKIMAEDKGYSLTEDYLSEAKRYFEYKVRNKTERFSNAREARALLTESIKIFSQRIVDENKNSPNTKSVKVEKVLTIKDIHLPEEIAHVQNINTKNELKATPPMLKKISADCVKDSLAKCYEKSFLKDETAFREEVKKSIVNIKTVSEDEDNVNSGTGFLISSSGLILTSNHVLSQGKIYALFEKEGKYPCEIVNICKNVDMALLQIKCDKEKTFPYLKIADKACKISDGEDIRIFGYAWRDKTVSSFTGHISGAPQMADPYVYYRIDSGSKKGQSGGPVISREDGAVIGVFVGSETKAGEKFEFMFPIRYFWEKFVKN